MVSVIISFVESEKSDIGGNGPEQTHQMTLLKIVQTLIHFVTASSLTDVGISIGNSKTGFVKEQSKGDWNLPNISKPMMTSFKRE